MHVGAWCFPSSAVCTAVLFGMPLPFLLVPQLWLHSGYHHSRCYSVANRILRLHLQAVKRLLQVPQSRDASLADSFGTPTCS